MTRWHKILHGFVADTTDEVIADASTSEQLKHYSHCTKVQYLLQAIRESDSFHKAAKSRIRPEMIFYLTMHC